MGSRAARVSAALAAGALAGCSLLVDTGGLSDGPSASDAGDRPDAPAPALASDAGPDAPADVDAADGGGPRCDPAKPFGAPVRIAELDSVNSDLGMKLTADELVVVFATSVNESSGDVYLATRTDRAAPFGLPVPVATTGADEAHPSISGDGLTLVYEVGGDLVLAKRATRADAFGSPVPLPLVSSPSDDADTFLTLDASQLWFASDRTGDYEIFWSDVTQDGLYGAPTQVTELGSSALDSEPVLSADGLTIYFNSDRSGNEDIWTATRPSTKEAFGAATQVTELDTTDRDRPMWLSPDGCALYISSDRPGTAGQMDYWVATRLR